MDTHHYMIRGSFTGFVTSILGYSPNALVIPNNQKMRFVVSWIDYNKFPSETKGTQYNRIKRRKSFINGLQVNSFDPFHNPFSTRQTDQPLVTIESSELLPSPGIDLPYKYSEFQEYFWDSMSLKSNQQIGQDIKDLMLSNVISSSQVDSQSTGGLFTSILTTKFSVGNARKFMRHSQHNTPNLSFSYRLGNLKNSGWYTC